MRISGAPFVLSSVFVVLVTLTYVSTGAWADDPSPVSDKKPSAACAAALLEASDQAVVQARAIASLLDMGEVRGYIEELTGLKPLSSGFSLRTRHTEERRAIARMAIKDYIERLGYTGVRIDAFNNGANVIVELPGTGRESGLIEVTAHYDSVVTGADDNGSGVALMLGMLGLFRHVEHDRPIRFVFMDLEERGMQGSDFHADQVTSGGQGSADQMAGAIVFDTIGWAHPESKKFLGVLEMGVARNPGSARRVAFGRELLYALHRGGGLDGLLVSPETVGAKPGTTDLGQYWYRDLPAVLWAAAYEDGFVNPHYHKHTDTLENMNWDYYRRMSEVGVQMVAYAARMRLANQGLLSERAWSVLREQEDRSIAFDQFKVPSAADRMESLDPQHMGIRRSMFDFFDREPSSTENQKPPKAKRQERPKSKDKKGAGVKPTPVETSTSSYAPYIDRYLSIVESTSGDDLTMFEMPKTWQGYNRAFVTAKGEVLDLVADTDEVLATFRNRVWEKNGGVYRVEPVGVLRPEVWAVPSLATLSILAHPVTSAKAESGTVTGSWDGREIRLTRLGKPSSPLQ